MLFRSVFTRKERTGIIVLVVLIIAVTCLPWFFSGKFNKPDRKLTNKIQQDLATARVNADTVHTRMRHDDERHLPHYDMPPEKKPAILFEFDPNTLSAEGWRKLGLRERAVAIIQKYLLRGGKFRAPADLKKIYGLREEEAKRLMPYVRIQPVPVAEQWKNREPFSSYKKREPAIIDINTADTTAFIALPGIGGKLARRIITFREKLGGFYAVEQVKETYGITDSTFQQILPFLQCAPGSIRTIDINETDAGLLEQHPYIDRNLANAIIKYRQQHGPYSSVDGLRQIVLVTPEIFQKIGRYLAVK